MEPQRGGLSRMSVALVLVATGLLISGGGNSEAEEIVFDLHYRSIGGSGDPIQCRHLYGANEPPGEPTPFFKAVQRVAKDARPVSPDRGMESLGWAALDLQDGKPTAAYVDLNRDGALGKEEKLDVSAHPGSPDTFFFVTPDFEMLTSKGDALPYRLLLRVGTREGDAPLLYWGSSCAWEGGAAVTGEPWILTLIDTGLDGGFTEFGVDRAVLRPVPENRLKRSALRHTPLSTIVCIREEFYSVRFEGGPSDERFRVHLSPYRGQTGRIRASIVGAPDVETRLLHVRFQGVSDPTAYFSLLSGLETITLPVGTYSTEGGYLGYGAGEAGRWHTNFWRGADVIVVSGETGRLAVGRLRVELRAREESEHHWRRGRWVFRKGVTVRLVEETTGIGGERYGRIHGPTSAKENTPLLRIVNADGNETTSGEMEYGRGTSSQFSWKTQDVQPGAYTAIVTRDTGPLGGEVEGRLELTIE